MAGVGYRLAAPAVLVAAALGLSACAASGIVPGGPEAASATALPLDIMRAPESLTAAAEPQPDGKMWALAGSAADAGLFELGASSGHVFGSIPVSNAARSVAETATGIIGLGLGTSQAGALELLNGSTAKVIATVPLPAPARDVAAGSSGSTFYVLTGRAGVASVTVVDARDDQVRDVIPVPGNAVSVVADIQLATLYVLQPDGQVNALGIADGRVMARFPVGTSGLALALSPDGSTLYALKGTQTVANVAVVDVATESVRRVIPAPSHCRELLVSASGRQLYEVVGTTGYGNIQVFGV
jgi:hypothetical protein